MKSKFSIFTLSFRFVILLIGVCVIYFLSCVFIEDLANPKTEWWIYLLIGFMIAASALFFVILNIYFIISFKLDEKGISQKRLISKTEKHFLWNELDRFIVSNIPASAYSSPQRVTRLIKNNKVVMEISSAQYSNYQDLENYIIKQMTLS